MIDPDIILEEFLSQADLILEQSKTPLRKHYEISNLIKLYEWQYDETKNRFAKLREDMAGFFPKRNHNKEYSKKLEECLLQQAK